MLSKHRRSITTSYSISRRLFRGADTRPICFFSKRLNLVSALIGICWKNADAHTKAHESNLSMGQRVLYSVDVPPSADIYEISEILERGESDGVWIFQEGYAYLNKVELP